MPLPKVIHYCWFGGNEKDPLTLRCIDSWKKYCPDCEIKEWNETNYDITKNVYMYQAYIAKRWGFVSDYARLDIIYERGGVYLDTDVELIRSIDSLLEGNGFLGFEQKAEDVNNWKINTGQGFGAVKDDTTIKLMRDKYDEISFIDHSGKENLTTCPTYNSMVLEELGVKMDNGLQQIGKIMIYPSDYFCPVNWKTKQCIITENTYSIHHFSGSWVSDEEKKKRKKQRQIDSILHIPNRVGKKILGVEKYKSLKDKLK